MADRVITRGPRSDGHSWIVMAEIYMIRSALELSGGSVKLAAKILGVHRTMLQMRVMSLEKRGVQFYRIRSGKGYGSA